MNVVAERKQQKEQKKYHKQVRAKKQESKAKEKKQHMEELKTMRKKRKGTNGGDLDVKSSLSTLSALPGLQKLGSADGDDGDDGDDGEKPSGYTSKSSSNIPQKSKKRKLKDQKYGFGGKKRGLKKNDAVSAASMKDFDTRKNNDVRGFVPTEFGFGKKPKKTMKQAKPKRLGKNRRNRKK